MVRAPALVIASSIAAGVACRADGTTTEALFEVRFVPMTGEAQG